MQSHAQHGRQYRGDGHDDHDHDHGFIADRRQFVQFDVHRHHCHEYAKQFSEHQYRHFVHGRNGANLVLFAEQFLDVREYEHQFDAVEQQLHLRQHEHDSLEQQLFGFLERERLGQRLHHWRTHHRLYVRAEQ